MCQGFNKSLTIAVALYFWAKNDDFWPKIWFFWSNLAKNRPKPDNFGLKSPFLAQKHDTAAIIRLLFNPWHMGMSRKLFSSSIQKSRTHNFVPLFGLSTQTIRKTAQKSQNQIRKPRISSFLRGLISQSSKNWRRLWQLGGKVWKRANLSWTSGREECCDSEEHACYEGGANPR